MLCAVLAATAGGCGTALNLSSGSYPCGVCCGNPEAPKPFGGVLLDCEGGKSLYEHGIVSANVVKIGGALFLWGIDLPLSALGDTATLPYTCFVHPKPAGPAPGNAPPAAGDTPANLPAASGPAPLSAAKPGPSP
jgi:hypothetical protein